MTRLNLRWVSRDPLILDIRLASGAADFSDRCDAKQHWSHNGTFCALARPYVIAGPQTVLTMSPLANRRARLAKDIFPARHSPDWHQNDETRHELEKLYADWGLDIRWLRGERSHVRAAPSRKERRPRAKSRRVKQMSK